MCEGLICGCAAFDANAAKFIATSASDSLFIVFAHQGVFNVSPRFKIGLAWQIVSAGTFTIIDRNGGLPNTSTYIGFAPQKKLGVVILVNRGKQHATGIGRQIIHALAQDQSEPSSEGEANPDTE